MKKLVAVILTVAVLASVALACTTPTTSTEGGVTTKTVTTTATKTVATTTTQTVTAAAAPAKTIELTMASYEAEAHYRSPMLKWIAEELAARTNGQVKTTVYTGGALGKNTLELSDNVRKGVVDIGVMATRSFAGFIPAIELLGNPVFITDTGAISYIVWDLIGRGYIKVDGMKILMANGTESGGMLFATKKKVTNVAGMQGLLVGGIGSTAPYIKQLGGQLVETPPPALYPGLERGVIESCLIGVGLGTSLKLDGVVKYICWDQWTQDCQMTLMNEDRYNSLPADVKLTLMELCREAESQVNGLAYAELATAEAYFRQNPNVEIYRWSAADFQVLRDTLAPLQAEKIADMDAKGLKGTEIMKIAMDDLKLLGNIK